MNFASWFLAVIYSFPISWTEPTVYGSSHKKSSPMWSSSTNPSFESWGVNFTLSKIGHSFSSNFTEMSLRVM